MTAWREIDRDGLSTSVFPVYPVGVFDRYPVAAAIIAETGRVTQTDDAFPATVVLSATAAALGGMVDVRFHPDAAGAPCDPFVALVGATGTGKTSVANIILRPVYGIAADLSADPDHAVTVGAWHDRRSELEAAAKTGNPGHLIELASGTPAGVKANARRELIAHNRSRPTTRTIVSDATPEALQRLVGDHVGVYFVTDEGVELLLQLQGVGGRAGRHGVMTGIYSGSPGTITRNTVDDRIYQRPRLGLNIGLQPEFLLPLFAADDAARAQGFVGRLTLAPTRNRVGMRDVRAMRTPVAPSVAAEWDALIRRVYASTLTIPEGETAVVTLSADGRRVALDWEEHVETVRRRVNTGDLAYADYAGRMAEHALRYSVALHYLGGNDHRTQISAETFADATRVAEYHAEVAEGYARGGDASSDIFRVARQIAGWVAEDPDTRQGLTARDVRRATKRRTNHAPAALVVAALQRLTDVGAAESVEYGRTERWAFHPGIGVLAPTSSGIA